MANVKAPFTVPVGVIGIKIVNGNAWQEKTFPKDNSDGNPAKWPPMPPYRKADSRNYLIRLAHAWVQREGSAKTGL